MVQTIQSWLSYTNAANAPDEMEQEDYDSNRSEEQMAPKVISVDSSPSESASIFVSLSHTSPLGPWHFATTAFIASLSLAVNVKEWVRTFSRRWSLNRSRRLTNKWLRRIIRTSIHPSMPGVRLT
jgi:hypothetical protein